MPLKSRQLVGDLSAANSWVGPTAATATDSAYLGQPMGIDDSWAASVTGLWTGTIDLVRSLDGGTTWGALDKATENVEWSGSVTSGCLIKVGFGTNGYVSGTAHVILKVGQ